MIERRNWTRDELLVALKVYCELEFGQFDHRQAYIIEIANYLQRTPSSLAMKLCNFASLDPAMNGKGLKGASKADSAIMQEFLHNPEKVILESEKAYTELLVHKNKAKLSEKNIVFDYDFESIKQTEKMSQVKTRVVQQFFRKSVISSYHFKCAICEIGFQELLTASHIIPWSKSEEYRVDPTNGISLCTLHDRAFDRGFITFSEDYNLIIGSRLKSAKNLSIENMFIRFDNELLKLPFRFMPNKKHIEWHRTNIFAG